MDNLGCYTLCELVSDFFWVLSKEFIKVLILIFEDNPHQPEGSGWASDSPSHQPQEEGDSRVAEGNRRNILNTQPGSHYLMV